MHLPLAHLLMCLVLVQQLLLQLRPQVAQRHQAHLIRPHLVQAQARAQEVRTRMRCYV